MRSDFVLSVAIAWTLAILFVGAIELTARLVPTSVGQAPGIVDPGRPRVAAVPSADVRDLLDCRLADDEAISDRENLREDPLLDAKSPLDADAMSPAADC